MEFQRHGGEIQSQQEGHHFTWHWDVNNSISS